EGDQVVECATGGGWVAVGRRALGDQAAAGWILKRRLVKFLDIGAEGLSLFGDPLALRWSSFRELIDVDGDLTIHGRDDRQVVARPGDRPHLRRVEHQRLGGDLWPG